MSWYFTVLKNYAVFGGRARRKEYWMFLLFNIIFSMVWGFIAGAIAGATGSPELGLLAQLYTIAVLIPSIAVGVRRMHDTGHSGWWLLAPIVNLVFACADSEAATNEYGPNPKAV